MANIGFGSRVRIHGSQDSPTNACGAIYEIVTGKKTEMMYHLKNEKIVYVLRGQVRLWVIQDGILKNKDFSTGQTVMVTPGLAHQFEAIEQSILVEFGTNQQAYAGEGLEDVFIVEKGTPPVEDQTPSIVMTDEDKARVEEAVEQVTEEKEPDNKPAKRTRKKRVRKKKAREDN